MRSKAGIIVPVHASRYLLSRLKYGECACDRRKSIFAEDIFQLEGMLDDNNNWLCRTSIKWAKKAPFKESSLKGAIYALIKLKLRLLCAAVSVKDRQFFKEADVLAVSGAALGKHCHAACDRAARLLNERFHRLERAARGDHVVNEQDLLAADEGGIVRTEVELLLSDRGDGLIVDRDGVGHVDLGPLRAIKYFFAPLWRAIS